MLCVYLFEKKIGKRGPQLPGTTSFRQKLQNAGIQGRTPGGGKKHDSNRWTFVLRVQHASTFPKGRAADRKVRFCNSAANPGPFLQLIGIQYIRYYTVVETLDADV